MPDYTGAIRTTEYLNQAEINDNKNTHLQQKSQGSGCPRVPRHYGPD